MVAVYIILGLLVLVVAYLLIAPFYLEINTSKDLFRIRFHRLGFARLSIDDSIVLHWRVFGIGKDIDMLSLRKESNEHKTKKLKKVTKTSTTPPIYKIVGVVKSFRVNKFSLQLDTGNNELNGFLFPWFVGAGILAHRDLWINFIGRNELVMEIENSALRMMHAYLFTNKKS